MWDSNLGHLEATRWKELASTWRHAQTPKLLAAVCGLRSLGACQASLFHEGALMGSRMVQGLPLTLERFSLWAMMLNCSGFHLSQKKMSCSVVQRLGLGVLVSVAATCLCMPWTGPAVFVDPAACSSPHRNHPAGWFIPQNLPLRHPKMFCDLIYDLINTWLRYIVLSCANDISISAGFPIHPCLLLQTEIGLLRQCRNVTHFLPVPGKALASGYVECIASGYASCIASGYLIPIIIIIIIIINN